MLATLLGLWAALAVQAPDSAKTARYSADLRALDDSLGAVRGAAAQFRADLTYASPDLVIARAQRMRGRCLGGQAAAARLDSTLAAGPYLARAAHAEARLRRDLAAVRRALGECRRDFDTGLRYPAADSAKAWGPYRLSRLEAAIRVYTAAAQILREQAGIK